jgi:hypothetical protein
MIIVRGICFHFSQVFRVVPIDVVVGAAAVWAAAAVVTKELPGCYTGQINNFTEGAYRIYFFKFTLNLLGI